MLKFFGTALIMSRMKLFGDFKYNTNTQTRTRAYAHAQTNTNALSALLDDLEQLFYIYVPDSSNISYVCPISVQEAFLY